MSSIERSNELLPERRRNQQTLIRNYMKTNAVINNEGYINRNKLPTNMRFLTLNIKGLDPKTIVKIGEIYQLYSKVPNWHDVVEWGEREVDPSKHW